MDAILDKIVGSSTWHRTPTDHDLQSFIVRRERSLSQFDDEQLQDAAFDLSDVE